jgi:hypothetical protein
MSKGSNPRQIDKEAYDTNFDKIFGKKPLSALDQEKQIEETIETGIKQAAKEVFDENDTPLIDAGIK